MQNTYWTLFAITIAGLLFALGFLSYFITQFVKKKVGIVSIRLFVGLSVVMAFLAVICILMLIPLVKDFHLAAHNEYVEDIATVVEFTDVYFDADGNGQTHYSKPKFYIPEKDEYVVLYVADVEIGEEYRIRYYPNTKICEAVPTE